MDSKLTEAQIYEKFADIVAASLRIERSRVTMDAHLMDNLDAESLDLIEITMETESAFDVWLPEKSILDTAAEVFGPDILVRGGRTDGGRQGTAAPPDAAREHAIFRWGSNHQRRCTSYFLTGRTLGGTN